LLESPYADYDEALPRAPLVTSEGADGRLSAASSPGANPEAISPELVLVDPELRRRVLAELVQNDALEALGRRPARVYPPPPRPAAEPPRAPVAEHRPTPEAPRRRASRWPKALRTPAVLPGLVGLSIFVALGVSEARVNEPTFATGPTATAPLAPSPEARSKPPAKLQPVKRPAPRSRAVTRRSSAAVERDVLARIVRSPAGKIPRALIDPTTGLAKNNLQASCRRAAAPATFVCEVRPVVHKAGEGLTVRYRLIRHKPAEVSWGRYRGR
jgi:hypothetical protein